MKAILNYRTGLLTITGEIVDLPSKDAIEAHAQAYMHSEEFDNLASKYNVYRPGFFGKDSYDCEIILPMETKLSDRCYYIDYKRA